MLFTNEIGIIGSGRLGICLALSLEQKGFNILCTDINTYMLDTIKNKTLISSEQYVNEMLIKSKNIKTTYNNHDIFEKQLIFIVVATPSLIDGSYNHSAIEEVVNNIEIYYSTKKNLIKNILLFVLL